MPTIALLWCLLGQAPVSAHLQIDLVFNGPRLPRDLKAAAMEEASRIWAAYDVDIRESSAKDAGRDGAIRLSVGVTPRPARNVATDALGSINFIDGLPTASILLYPNTISALVPLAMMLGPGVH